MTDKPHWRVVVCINGEEVVAIEPEMLAGRELTEDEASVVRNAAYHLMGFIGPEYEEEDPEPEQDALPF